MSDEKPGPDHVVALPFSAIYGTPATPFEAWGLIDPSEDDPAFVECADEATAQYLAGLWNRDHLQVAVAVAELRAPGKARRTDPATSHSAASVITARASSARVRLLEAFGRASANGYALTDEQAAINSALSLQSEYATRCSELRSAGCIEVQGRSSRTASGQERVTSMITDLGRGVLLQRSLRSAP